jgi:hypothetical protein
MFFKLKLQILIRQVLHSHFALPQTSTKTMLVSVELFQWSAYNLYSFISILVSHNFTLKLWLSHQSILYSSLTCFMSNSTPATMQYQNRMFIKDKWPYPYVPTLPNVAHIIMSLISYKQASKQGFTTKVYNNTSVKYLISFIYFSFVFIAGSLCLLKSWILP